MWKDSHHWSTILYIHVLGQHFINTSVSKCVFGHVWVSGRAFNRVCVDIHDAPVLNKWPPCLCGFLPGVPDAWIMWCRVLGGHIGSIVLGSSLNVALNLHWVKERFTSSAQPSMHFGCKGGVCWTNPLQAESGVICLTGDTAINLSCPLSFAQNQISTG